MDDLINKGYARKKQTFKDELASLSGVGNDTRETANQNNLKKNSSIYKLDPVLENGLLRVGGRLEHAPIENDAKHPIILPKRHHVTKLIIEYFHRASAHSGIEYTLSLIRQRYWILGARSNVRNIINTCFSCRRRQAPNRSSTPFDASSREEEENGGNFVKGEKELRKALQEWNQNQIHEFLLQQEIKWTFNPPAASHHGGVWERCIRTVRKVMKALLKQQVLDDEGLSTLMCEVESIVNGRPINKVSDDVKDLNALTPNHLLLLRAENYSCRRWRQVQYLSNVFWRRWTREYLPSQQQRQRWTKLQ
ncbi:uncharacterized protein [Montipora capricornis]|uniref:uncharacterized protein n=1 Tax=Montipora capricornis TaxID=246305 RepID=UPI0035F146B8